MSHHLLPSLLPGNCVQEGGLLTLQSISQAAWLHAAELALYRPRDRFQLTTRVFSSSGVLGGWRDPEGGREERKKRKKLSGRIHHSASCVPDYTHQPQPPPSPPPSRFTACSEGSTQPQHLFSNSGRSEHTVAGQLGGRAVFPILATAGRIPTFPDLSGFPPQRCIHSPGRLTVHSSRRQTRRNCFPGETCQTSGCPCTQQYRRGAVWQSSHPHTDAARRTDRKNLMGLGSTSLC